MEYTVKMVLEKETPNTIRYKEVTEPGKPPVVPTLYIPKWIANGAKTITVSIEIPD